LANRYQTIDVDTVFDALVAPIRREVVEILGHGPRPAGELANAAGVAPSTMSRHLRVLLDAGVVAAARVEDDARIRVFSLRPESMVTLREWLDDLEATWAARLESFRAHAERSTR
jgi:DNA-binding transcriptional ArsR family regulator